MNLASIFDDPHSDYQPKIRVTGATLVGAVLFGHPTVEYHGAKLTQIRHRSWVVTLPGAQPIEGLNARQAAAVLDAWLPSLKAA